MGLPAGAEVYTVAGGGILFLWGDGMRVLVGCEESGIVRDAFIARGHEAWSNDLLPSRRRGPHLQMDVVQAINSGRKWDIIILHPDCTAMAVSGNRWYGHGTAGHEKRLRQIAWTRDLWALAKERARVGCALENPVSMIWGAIGKPQYIQPWMFGHGETKRTGILTDRLPALVPTKIVAGREQRIWKMAPSETRKRDRSETYQGIADAFAAQWGALG